MKNRQGLRHHAEEIVPQPPLDPDRRKALLDYFAADFVCPYAKAEVTRGINSIEIDPSTLDLTSYNPDLGQLLADHRTTLSSTSVVIFNTNYNSHQKAHVAAKRALLALRICGEVDNGDKCLVDFKNEHRDIFEIVEEPEMFISGGHTFVKYQKGAREAENLLFPIAMGPLYDESHPRYAPVFCIVLTNLSDINRAKEHAGVRNQIRGRMIQKLGADFAKSHSERNGPVDLAFREHYRYSFYEIPLRERINNLISIKARFAN